MEVEKLECQLVGSDSLDVELGRKVTSEAAQRYVPVMNHAEVLLGIEAE